MPKMLSLQTTTSELTTFHTCSPSAYYYYFFNNLTYTEQATNMYTQRWRARVAKHDAL